MDTDEELIVDTLRAIESSGQVAALTCSNCSAITDATNMLPAEVWEQHQKACKWCGGNKSLKGIDIHTWVALTT